MNSITKWSECSDILLHPETVFRLEQLEKVKPYAIISGVGCKAKIWVDHDCDCEFCTKGDSVQETVYGRSEKAIREEHGSDAAIESLGEAYFVMAVQQRSGPCSILED